MRGKSKAKKSCRALPLPLRDLVSLGKKWWMLSFGHIMRTKEPSLSNIAGQENTVAQTLASCTVGLVGLAD